MRRTKRGNRPLHTRSTAEKKWFLAPMSESRLYETHLIYDDRKAALFSKAAFFMLFVEIQTQRVKEAFGYDEADFV